MKVGMPAEADYDMIRRNFWLVSDAAYKMALREAAAKEAAFEVKPANSGGGSIAGLGEGRTDHEDRGKQGSL